MTLTAEWKEWREIALANGISSHTFQARRKRGGKTPKEAATEPLRYRSDLTAEHYKIAKSNGIRAALAFKRYDQLFWSIEDAITKKPREIDEDYLHWREIAKANDISYVTYWRRVKSGISHHEAATMDKQKRGRKRKNHGEKET